MNLRWILSFATPWRATLLFCSALMLLETGVALAVPWLVGHFAAGVLAGTAGFDPALLLVLLALFAVQGLLKFASALLLGNAAEAILADLRTRLHDHLLALPLHFFQQRKHGEVLSLLTSDVYRLANFISATLPGLLPTLLTVLGAFALMLKIDWRLSAVVLVMLPLFYLVLKVLGRKLRPMAHELQEAHAQALSVAEENLHMLPVIKTFTREAEQSGRYKAHIERLLRLSRQERGIYAAMGPSIQFLAASGLVLVLWLLGAQDQGAGQVRSPAEMLSFLLYAALLTRPISGLANVYGQTRNVTGALQRLGEALLEPAEPYGNEAKMLPPVRGDIRFENIGFAYPGREPVLQGFDLHIQAGETVALTGKNGAGKSTLAHLLLRLMHPQQGRIFIDGVDIEGVSLTSLRSQIGVVQQHVLLFNGTVRDNIVWGQIGASDEQVQQAAQVAQADEFIKALPQGYDTVIGDQGVRLSGGQRQRIALARAMLKAPPILILDESTAMFDPQGEKDFIGSCRNTLANRTVILITHRPASLALADRVITIGDPNHDSF